MHGWDHLTDLELCNAAENYKTKVKSSVSGEDMRANAVAVVDIRRELSTRLDWKLNAS